MDNLTLILGGARSGKSAFAERLASQRGTSILYIATAQALDDEMAMRIQRHRASRPAHWTTLEIPRNLAAGLEHAPIQADLIVLDCLTLLVSNRLVSLPDYENNPDEELASQQVRAEISGLLAAIQNSPAHWIVVSNEVGMGLVPAYALGRVYRDQLGWANQQVAAAAGEVFLMVAGLPWKLTSASMPPE